MTFFCIFDHDISRQQSEEPQEICSRLKLFFEALNAYFLTIIMSFSILASKQRSWKIITTKFLPCPRCPTQNE